MHPKVYIPVLDTYVQFVYNQVACNKDDTLVGVNRSVPDGVRWTIEA